MVEYAQAMDETVDRETLQRFLSDLARLGARYGVELVTDVKLGGIRLAPLSDLQGGYLAERADDGHRILSSYAHGVAFDDSTDYIVGDDFHPEARQERARLWKEENAEALSEQNEAHRLLLNQQQSLFVSSEEGTATDPEDDRTKAR